MVRQFTTHEGATAYILTVGKYADQQTFGVMVGVTAEQAARFAAAETAARARTETSADMIAVDVEVTMVYAPPLPDTGALATGAECDDLPAGSIIARTDQAFGTAAPLIRTWNSDPDDGPRWVRATAAYAGESNAIGPLSADGKYTVLYRSEEN